MSEQAKNKPVLVIMAAGMGSRYGGLKQIDPIDEEGHIIMDFSIFDAKKVGFEKVVFIIKRENEADFHDAVGNRISEVMEVAYVFQEVANIPDEFAVPEGRIKPWGTGHAVLSCIQDIEGPFAVINADDYYGREAFALIYQYLTTHVDDEKYRYTMVGYALENTVTENGHVARGVCDMNARGELLGIDERTRIEKRGETIAYTPDNGESWIDLPEQSIVSMNMWGFTRSILLELQSKFPAFLQEGLQEDSLKCEYFLPEVVSELIQADKASVVVLKSRDKWYGVTYQEDKPIVVNAIRKMKESGLYPQYLWK